MQLAPEDERALEIVRAADALAARLRESRGSFAEDFRHFAAEMQALLDTVGRSGARFTFDRDGRPAAIAVVRAALPAMERSLLDAVLEDHEAELAAWKEALFQGMLACRRRPPADTPRED
jgi:hypothetical protein